MTSAHKPLLTRTYKIIVYSVYSHESYVYLTKGNWYVNLTQGTVTVYESVFSKIEKSIFTLQKSLSRQKEVIVFGKSLNEEFHF